MVIDRIADPESPPHSPPRAAARGERRPEIDWLKGLAILFVLMIHARPLEDHPIHEFLINRAVPIFIVLFGATSELWWRSRAAHGDAPVGAWYRSRSWRLMVPVWGMLLVWWPFALTFDAKAPHGLQPMLATIAGYMPWIGTGWFVTMILQLVICFPLLRIAVDRLGIVLMLFLSLTMMVLSHLYALVVISWVHAIAPEGPSATGFYAFYYYWIFAPQHFFLVVCGIALARAPRHHALRSIAAAVVLAAGIVVLRAGLIHDVFAAAAFHAVLDVPLTIVLLAIVPAVGLWTPAALALAWCGTTSWGIYLGQMLVHSVLHMFGPEPEKAAITVRWAYFACLLVGAVGFVTIGNAVRAAVERNMLSATEP